MSTYTLLVGNDINNISPGVSWAELLVAIKNKYNVPLLENGNKPFPMLYEEIFLHAIKDSDIKEKELKIDIANHLSSISQNELHGVIRQLPIQHIITTNYEFSLEGSVPSTNTSLIRETTYSVFRQYQMENKTYWHIHGDSNAPLSINLGYEHYCGQLQRMRDYVVNGPDYTSPTIHKASLIKRLSQGKNLNIQSWIDLFFTHDVHILGLSLDFVEIDLWWLLTYRARNKYYKKSTFINNRLYYYISAKWADKSKDKLQLLRANDVEVVIINEAKKLQYYKQVLNRITTPYT